MPKTNWGQEIRNTTPQERGQVIPVTEATFQVKSAQAGTSKSGKEFIEIVAVVLDGEYVGTELTDQKYYSPQSKVAVRIWWEQLAALGVTDEWILEADPTTAEIAMSTIGVQFRGRITIDEFNGRKRNKFDIWEFLGREGDDEQPESTDGLDEFAADTAEENPDAADALPDEGPEKTPPTPAAVTEDEQHVLVTPGGEAADPADEDPWGDDS